MSPIPPDSVPKHIFLWTDLLFGQKEKLIFHLCKLLEEEGTGRLLNSAQEKYSPCSYLQVSGNHPTSANVGGPSLRLWSDPGIRWVLLTFLHQVNWRKWYTHWAGRKGRKHITVNTPCSLSWQGLESPWNLAAKALRLAKFCNEEWPPSQGRKNWGSYRKSKTILQF